MTNAYTPAPRLPAGAFVSETHGDEAIRQAIAHSVVYVPDQPWEVGVALATMREALACIEAHVPATTFAPRMRLRDAIENLEAAKLAPRRTLTVANASEIERQIAERVVLAALDAGFEITVDSDGDDEPELVRSRDLEAIGSAMGSAGQDVLTFHRDGKLHGFVTLIWGNGCDLISDSTAGNEMNLLLREAEELASLFADCT